MESWTLPPITKEIEQRIAHLTEEDWCAIEEDRLREDYAEIAPRHGLKPDDINYVLEKYRRIWHRQQHTLKPATIQRMRAVWP